MATSPTGQSVLTGEYQFPTTLRSHHIPPPVPEYPRASQCVPVCPSVSQCVLAAGRQVGVSPLLHHVNTSPPAPAPPPPSPPAAGPPGPGQRPPRLPHGRVLRPTGEHHVQRHPDRYSWW